MVMLAMMKDPKDKKKLPPREINALALGIKPCKQ
jgi:hypothetical protein